MSLHIFFFFQNVSIWIMCIKVCCVDSWDDNLFLWY